MPRTLASRKRLHSLYRDHNIDRVFKLVDEYREDGGEGGSVYFVQGGKYVKIGFTTKPIAARVAELQTGNPHKLKVLAVIPGDLFLEAELHRLFGVWRMAGEWFRYSAPGLPQLIDHANSRLFV